jgi:hypothetical protein
MRYPRDIYRFDTDLFQWHQFITQTVGTIALAVEIEFQLLALSCDYLMHAVLSVSALHLAHLNPEQKETYKGISARHHDLALGPFEAATSNITAENCHQVFAVSTLVLVSLYASSRTADFLVPAPEAASGLVNWITRVRKYSSIVQTSFAHIRSGPLNSLMIREEKITELALLGADSDPDEDSRSLDKLARYVTSLPSIKSSTTVAEMEAYTEAIALLQKLLAATSQLHDSVSLRSLASLWPSKISETFVRILADNRPPALTIMAHYCLLLQRCQSCWFLKDRAYGMFDAVRHSLAVEWMPCIEHPIRVLERE